MLLIIAILIIYLVNDYISDSGPIELDGVEIREYEGKRLSSVDDFRENSIKGPQYIDIDTYKLSIGGLVEIPKEYAYEDVTDGFQSYKKVVTLDCVEGWSATILWEGILLKDLIAEAQPTSEANTIIFYAHDGYSTSFPIEYVMDNDLILAHKMNDVTMPAERGYPFQLVAESKWGYKWIKWITHIELSDDPTYEGYWESRGYSNTGNLDESFRG
jgi:DMSO/TMAO reductase YedYZ molybdopterin-dependent catalytic subunit